MFRKGPLLTKIGKNQAKAGSRVRLGALVIRFWGSNCRCYVIAIIKSEEKFWEDEDKRGTDNETITELPENFKKWASLNQDRIARAEKRGTQPYFVRDNRERVKQAVKKGDVMMAKEGGMKVVI